MSNESEAAALESGLFGSCALATAPVRRRCAFRRHVEAMLMLKIEARNKIGNSVEGRVRDRRPALRALMTDGNVPEANSGLESYS